MQTDTIAAPAADRGTEDTIVATIAHIEQELAALRVRLARGSSDLTAAAAQAVIAAEAPAETLPAALERTLRARCMTIGELGAALGAEVVPVLHEAHRTGKICNAGSELRPVWTWILGDEGETAELTAKIEDLITLRPMLMAELADATGARRNRISGALNKIQLRRKVRNLGSASVARWFLPVRR